jgi:hypothetical protein
MFFFVSFGNASETAAKITGLHSHAACPHITEAVHRFDIDRRSWIVLDFSAKPFDGYGQRVLVYILDSVQALSKYYLLSERGTDTVYL